MPGEQFTARALCGRIRFSTSIRPLNHPGDCDHSTATIMGMEKPERTQDMLSRRELIAHPSCGLFDPIAVNAAPPCCTGSNLSATLGKRAQPSTAASVRLQNGRPVKQLQDKY